MNILCAICSDLLNQAENIYVTKCGHIFHHHCLIQWIERSKTCPQCRNKVTDKCMFRLFPTISNENNSEDAATLQSRLDDVQLQLRQQKAKYKEKEDKMARANAKLKKQDDLLKSYEERMVNFDSKVLALREQLEFSNIQNKELQKYKAENEALKKNMQTLDGLQKVLNATSEDVEQMLNSYTDVRTIATFATALKRALCDSESKKNESRDLLHAAKQQLALEKKTNAELRKKILELEDEIFYAQTSYDMLKHENVKASLESTLEKQSDDINRYIDSMGSPQPVNEPTVGNSAPDTSINNGNPSNDIDDDVGDVNEDVVRKKREAWLKIMYVAGRKAAQAEASPVPVVRGLPLTTEQKVRAVLRMEFEHEMKRMLSEKNSLVSNIVSANSPYLNLCQANRLTLEALKHPAFSGLENKNNKPYANIYKERPETAPTSSQSSESTIKNNTGESSNSSNNNKSILIRITPIDDSKKPPGERNNSSGVTLSIFHKKEPMRIECFDNKISNTSEVSYDGMGGHSKPDTFPVPNPTPVKSFIPRVTAKHKLKRPTPSGSQDIGKMLKKAKNK